MQINALFNRANVPLSEFMFEIVSRTAVTQAEHQAFFTVTNNCVAPILIGGGFCLRTKSQVEREVLDSPSWPPTSENENAMDAQSSEDAEEIAALKPMMEKVTPVKMSIEKTEAQ